MGSEPYIVEPGVTSGNYFETKEQRARRWQATAGVTVPSRRWHGVHNLQSGIQLEHVEWTQAASRGSIEFRRQDETLSQQTTLAGPADFSLSDLHVGLYVQDSWTVAKPLVLHAGMRWDWARVLHHSLVSPRIAANILPWSDERAKLSIAWGVYYQPMRLATVGPSYDQQPRR